MCFCVNYVLTKEKKTYVLANSIKFTVQFINLGQWCDETIKQTTWTIKISWNEFNFELVLLLLHVLTHYVK